MTHFKKSIFFFSLLLFFSSCGFLGVHIHVHNPRVAGKYPKFSQETILLGELTPIRKNFDVVFYDLDINVNRFEKKVGGWVEIKAIALADLDSIQLDLDQPLAVEELRWQTRDGAALNYSRKYRAVYVKLNQQVKRGETFSVHVKYSGKPVVARKPPWSGGMVWKTDKQGNPWIGVVCETEGSSIWFPCKDHTSDEPDSVHMKFTIPDTNLFVVSNGQFTGVQKTATSASYSWKLTYPINLYNITFYVGNFAKVEDTLQGLNPRPLQLNYYVLKPNVALATEHFKQVKEDIRIYESLYGEYPWHNDGFKLVESPYEGQEHQSAIAYGNGYKNDLNGKDDYIIVHEMGHEWFGNAVTAADLADVWLQEGFTTYGEALYLEKRYNAEEAETHMLEYRIMIKNKFPVVGPVGRRYFDYHDGDVYTKGAWVLLSLRTTINNDSLFFAIIKTFYEQNKEKQIDSKVFIELVNKMTGQDYNWFFDQYLYKNEAPVLEIEYVNSRTLYYRWANVPDNFNKLPVLLGYSGLEPSVTIYPSTKVQKQEVPAAYMNNESTTIYNNKTLFGFKNGKKMYKVYAEQMNKR